MTLINEENGSEHHHFAWKRKEARAAWKFKPEGVFFRYQSGKIYNNIYAITGSFGEHGSVVLRACLYNWESWNNL